MTSKLKKFSTCDKDGSTPWSNLNHDLLLLIMMRLGVFDFIAFKGVCKSWRSVAVDSWNKFMVSRQPMRLSVSTCLNKTDCYLEENIRRKLKTVISHFDDRITVGVTCGYLIFYAMKFRDFWLVNPFTRKQLHFPNCPLNVSIHPKHIRGILVFSPLMCGWVFVVLPNLFSTGILFSLAGKQARWRYVSSDSGYYIYDLHFFKGKIYIMNVCGHLFELRLAPKPILTLLKLKNRPWLYFRNKRFVSSCENLYVVDRLEDASEAVEADFDEMKWVSSERTIGEYAVFVSELKCDGAVKPDTWAHPWTRYERLNYSDGGDQSKKNGTYLTTNVWYFPHDCLNDSNSDMVNGALLNILEE